MLDGVGRNHFLIISILIFWLRGMRRHDSWSQLSPVDLNSQWDVAIVHGPITPFTIIIGDESQPSEVDWIMNIELCFYAQWIVIWNMIWWAWAASQCLVYLVYLSFINYQLNSSAKKSSQMISFIKSQTVCLLTARQLMHIKDLF